MASRMEGRTLSPAVVIAVVYFLMACMALHSVYLAMKVSSLQGDMDALVPRILSLSKWEQKLEQRVSAFTVKEREVDKLLADNRRASKDVSARTDVLAKRVGDIEEAMGALSEVTEANSKAIDRARLPPAPSEPALPLPPGPSLASSRGELMAHLRKSTYDCKLLEMIGGEEDVEIGRVLGAWPVCLDGPDIAPPCVAYLFSTSGRAPGPLDTWWNEKGCEVHNFDPVRKTVGRPASRGRGGHVGPVLHSEGLGGMNGVVRGVSGHYDDDTRKYWKLKTVKTTMRELGHTRLSYLKFDVDGGEWDALHNMVASGVLDSVGQITGVVHLWSGQNVSREEMARSMATWLGLLKRLHQQGFHLFHFSVVRTPGGGGGGGGGDGVEAKAVQGGLLAGACCFEVGWVHSG